MRRPLTQRLRFDLAVPVRGHPHDQAEWDVAGLDGALSPEDVRIMLPPSQCRAARALLDWTKNRLSQETGLSAVTIGSFEGGRDARDSNRRLLRLALETAGIVFIEKNGGGSGVRLRDPEA